MSLPFSEANLQAAFTAKPTATTFVCSGDVAPQATLFMSIQGSVWFNKFQVKVDLSLPRGSWSLA